MVTVGWAGGPEVVVLFLLLVFGMPFLLLVVVLLLDRSREDESAPRQEQDVWGALGRDRFPGGGPSSGPLG